MVKYRLNELDRRARVAPVAAPPSESGRAGVPKELFRRMMAWLQDRQSKRRALAELRALDDRLLNDIGVRRVDIAARVYAAESRSDRSTGA